MFGLTLLIAELKTFIGSSFDLDLIPLGGINLSNLNKLNNDSFSAFAILSRYYL